jgi:predicted dehydrogenase
MHAAEPPVRIGLLGYGKGGHVFHAPLIASARGCELVGIITRSPERRALIEADQSAAPCFDSLEQLADSGAEAVAISTPADTLSALTR